MSHAFPSLFALTTISSLCYSRGTLVFSHRMPSTRAMTLCEESALSMRIIAFPAGSAPAWLHGAPIEGAEAVWQVDFRHRVLSMAVRSQQIMRYLTRTVAVHQDHAGQRTHRVADRVPT